MAGPRVTDVRPAAPRATSRRAAVYPHLMAMPPAAALTSPVRAFIEARRTAVLVTVAADGQPRPVPVCFVLDRVEGSRALLYTPLDQKPKRYADVRRMARVRDIIARPDVTMLFEQWDEDWTRLAWLRARGTAVLEEPDADPETHRRVVVSLRRKYSQYRSHALEQRPMICVTIHDTSAWSADGRLAAKAGG